MISFDKTEVMNFHNAMRGARNPLNSWNRMDSHISDEGDFVFGENDLGLAKRLINAGTDHRKFIRQIFISVDITAPLYWWKEYDTYKVGTVANSCSTMHKIHSKEFVLDDFSHEHLFELDVLNTVIGYLNHYRNEFLITKDKKCWWQMIQMLPSSYNQKRTVMLNYEVLANIYKSRKNHKLDEWRDFCKWIETLPYGELITGEDNGDTV